MPTSVTAPETGKAMLLSWADNPSPGRGIHTAVDKRGGFDWTFTSYYEIRDQAYRIGQAILRSGVREGDVVALAQRAGPAFIASFFGALMAGATPAPVPIPAVYQTDAYSERFDAVFAAARPALVLAGDGQAEVLSQMMSRQHDAVPVHRVSQVLAAGEASPARPANGTAAALLQFTSGSSGNPKGLQISPHALMANLTAIAGWLDVEPSADAAVSWLPVHHDMGLVGSVLTAVVSGTDLWLLQPEQFLRRPRAYLERFGSHGATVAILPGFALDYLVRRIKPDELDGFDFRNWRAIVVGAERVDAGSLEAAARLLGQAGLRPEAFTPAYGLAEATLAVTGLSCQERPTVVSVSPRALRLGGTVEVLPPGEDGHARIVGCGRPLEGITIQIADQDGLPVPEGIVGEVRVRTPSLADKYRTPAGDRGLNLDAGWLCTGDAGFVREGQLYVLGRFADSIKVRGQLIFAEDLEQSLRRTGAVGERAVVLLGYHEGIQHVVGIFEKVPASRLDEAQTLLTAAVPDAFLSIIHVPRGAIKFTTSGKPRRQVMWEDFRNGMFNEALHVQVPCPTLP
jgi:acyl-CoA synthetase (AMP-forming)/AMP-acid ligase II